MMERWQAWLVSEGLAQPWAGLTLATIAGFALVILCVVVNVVAKRILVRVIRAVIERSSVTWDDVFLEKGVFDRLSHLAPAVVLHALAPVAFSQFPRFASAIQSLALVYMAVMALLSIDAFLNATLGLYQRTPVSRRVPIKGFVQVLKILLAFLGVIFVLSNLLGKSPLVFLSGLGAFTAVLLLIFKDSILGLVAGVQLTANNMVRVGDWIEMPRYGADGDVIDVSLMTVKVQNWDKTISTVPAYALVSDSFRNWRGMSDSGGRRIKRAVYIDVSSIKFCDAEMLERFKKFQAIQEYVDRKVAEVQKHNTEQRVDESVLLNGRRLTNIGTFRAYLEAYLRRHPKVHQDMTFLVRQLAPGPQGLPLEIYVFSRDQAWARYEAIQADIFDHVLASVPLFDLRVYQQPSGSDVQKLAAGAA
jgi:miniconductance mechanosensitive channel